MKKPSLLRTRGKAILAIIGTLFTGAAVLIVLAKITVGFPWAIFFERLWLVLIFMLGLIISGYIYLYFRLSILNELELALERDQPLPREIIEPSISMMYSMPVAMALSSSIFIPAGTMVHALDLYLNFDFQARDALLLFSCSIMILCLCVTAIFFLLKNIFRPLFLRLSKKAPTHASMLTDRSWKLPGLKKINFRVPVRYKILFVAFTIFITGLWFSLFAYSMSMNILESENATLSSLAEVDSLRRNWMLLLYVQVALGIGIAVTMALLTGRDIVSPFKNLLNKEEMYGNSTEIPLETLSEDEIGETIQALNSRLFEINKRISDSARGLKSAVRRVTGAVEQIKEISLQARNLSSKQSGDATSQVAMISEVSASSLELSSTARAIAKHAEQIRDVSESSMEQGDTGIELVSSMIQQMENMQNTSAEIKKDLKEFNASTNEIKGILEIIEEISDQINLLSLNAELEAAGSGEAGRRFAVVASEIKRLAAGTLAASEQIRSLITSIIESSEVISERTGAGARAIEESTSMAEDVSNAFVQIFQYVQDITLLVKDISASTSQQQSATELINDNLQEMLEAASHLEEESRGIEGEVGRLHEAAVSMETIVREGKVLEDQEQ